MNHISAEDFINDINEKRFNQSRDKLMKVVESDFRLIAWICWGAELLFNNFSYQEMFNYIGQVEDKELKKLIIPLDYTISTENNTGVILDRFFLLKEKGKIAGILGIENQLNPYPYEELEAREFAYDNAVIFWETGNKEILDKKHYRNLIAPTMLWIFPDGPEKLKNTYDTVSVKLPDFTYSYNLEKNVSVQPKKEALRFRFDSRIYQFFLGNPLNINKTRLGETTKEGKATYSALLLDLIFGFNIEKEKRLELLGKIFNLKGELTESEVNFVNGLTEFGDRRFNNGEQVGFVEGKEKGIEASIKKLANYLIEQSKKEEKPITKEEALKQASEILKE